MKPAILLPLMVAAGLGLGGGSGVLVRSLTSPVEAKSRPPQPVGELVFVPTGPILTPLVHSNGRLAGYAEIEVQLQVSVASRELVEERLPILIDAVNLRTYRTPLASAPGGDIPDLTSFRKIITSLVPDAFGDGVVMRVAITQARPA